MITVGWFRVPSPGAGGDVPLSVLMTSASTVLAAAATPALTLALAGAAVPVDATAMCRSVAALVLGPVAGEGGGALTRTRTHAGDDS